VAISQTTVYYPFHLFLLSAHEKPTGDYYFAEKDFSFPPVSYATFTYIKLSG
jgi:hypothetical protein